MTEITYLVDLYQEAVLDLTASDGAWQSLLESMGRHYKRSFDNIVLIHVQNHDISQLGTKEEWLSHTKRTIKPNANSIAVLEMDQPEVSFKYYYDISDTEGTIESFQMVKRQQWTLENRYKTDIAEKLQSKYNINNRNLENILYSLSRQRVAQYQEFNLKIPDKLTTLMENSVYYMLASRVGLNVSQPHFEGIQECNQLDLFADLGIAVTGIAKPILQEIQSELVVLRKEREKENAKEIDLQSNRRGREPTQSHDLESRTYGTDWKTRKDLERLHDGLTAESGVKMGNDRQNQSKSFGDGQQNGGFQGRNDSTIAEKSTIPRDREVSRTGSPSQHDLQSGGGTGFGELSNLKKDVKSSSVSEKSLSLDDFFVLPQSTSMNNQKVALENDLAVKETVETVTKVAEENEEENEEENTEEKIDAVKKETLVNSESEIAVNKDTQSEFTQETPIESATDTAEIPLPFSPPSAPIIPTVTTILYSQVAPDYVVKSDHFKDRKLPKFNNEKGENYVLGFGKLETSTIVWNFLEKEEEHFKKVAIVTSHEIEILDSDMPPLAIEYLEQVTEKMLPITMEILEIREDDLFMKIDFQFAGIVYKDKLISSQNDIHYVTIGSRVTKDFKRINFSPEQEEYLLLLKEYNENYESQSEVEAITVDMAEPDEIEEAVDLLPENINESVVEEIPESVEETVEILPENINEPVVEEIPESVEEAVDLLSENINEPVVEEIPESVEETVDQLSENINEAVVEVIPESVEEEFSETKPRDEPKNPVNNVPLIPNKEQHLLFFDIDEYKKEDSPALKDKTKESTKEETPSYDTFEEDSDSFVQFDLFKMEEVEENLNLAADIEAFADEVTKETPLPRYVVEETPESFYNGNDVNADVEPYIILDSHFNDDGDLDRYYHDDMTYFTYSTEKMAQTIADNLNQKEKLSVEELNNMTPEPIFFVGEDVPRIDSALYKNKDVIGFNEKGVVFTYQLTGDTEFIAKELGITPDGKILKDCMNTETAQKYNMWLESINPEKKEPSKNETLPIESEKTPLNEKKEPLFFHNIHDLDLDISQYNDGDLIGYDHNGVQFQIGKIDDSVFYSETTSLGPHGEVLGDSMDSETYKKFRTWLENEEKTVQENTVEPVADSPILQTYEDNSENYRYDTNHNLYVGGAKTKYKANVEAIKVLKNLEEKHRPATKEEQITLAGYVGWGGLANALTENKAGWDKEYKEIKELLTDDEFKSASESTITAFYTEQMVIEQIYSALDKAGFENGTILDPAMGTGNFFSVIPEKLNGSKLYGVELDSISGRIAQKLYPSSNIQVRGFEDTSFPDQFFDVAIGNIPFNNFSIADPKYNKHNFKVHDYFIAKTLDKVRPNGIIAFISTKGLLDRKNPKVRKYIAQRAELVGAIRLPNTAFKQVAGTEVTTDILFLQKREQEIIPNDENTPWLNITENDDEIPVNQYFIDNPEMLLGKMVFDESMYGDKKGTSCHPIDGGNLERKLKIATGFLDFKYKEPTSAFSTNTPVGIEANPNVKNFSYAVVNDQIYFRENSKMYLQDFIGKKAERLKGMIAIHDDIKQIIDYQSSLHIRDTVSVENFQANLEKMRENLNEDYDNFVKHHGFLNLSANVSVFKLDGAAALLRSLERETEKNIYIKNDIFYKPTVQLHRDITEVYTAQDALMLSMNTQGQVDLDFMSSIYVDEQGVNVYKAKIIEELEGQIYQDPDKMKGDTEFGGYVVAEEYLSGYVVDKLKTAQFYEEENPDKYRKNIEALKIVQPLPLESHEISFRLGSVWIPLNDYQDFIYELCQTTPNNQNPKDISLFYSDCANKYYISGKSEEKNKVTINTVFGTGRKNAYEIIEESLNLKKIEVRDPVLDSDGKKTYVINKEETMLARVKQDAIDQQFQNWLFADPERSERLVGLYNETFNNVVVRRYNGDNLTLPNLNPNIKLRSHQKNVIAQGLYSGQNLLMAHEVGAGKTYSAIVLTHEMKRLGIAQKPLITVPNHLVGQWADSFQELYPDANIMVATSKDLSKNNRKQFVARIATSNYDAIIMPHSSFELIKMSKAYQKEAVQAEIDVATDAIKAARLSAGSDPWGTKQLELFVKNMTSKYERLISDEIKDDVVNFEELGVDALIVDESHVYKNNFSHTKLRVAGLNNQPSNIAMDMHLKAQYINKINDARGVVYLTGTPVSNSLAEIFIIQNTLQPQELAKRGLNNFDSWVSAYGEIVSEMEIKPEGNGWQMKERLANFYNIPELMLIFRQIADIQTSEMLHQVPVPLLKTGKEIVIDVNMTPDQKVCMDDVVQLAEDIRLKLVNDTFLRVTQLARLLALDARNVDPDADNDLDSKVNKCAIKAAEIYVDTDDEKLTQIIFCDQGVPNKDNRYNNYDAMRETMISHGVKPEEIAFIHDYPTPEKKGALYEQMRTGEMRILIASTGKCGTGMNIQDKLIALHHADIPWKPSDLIQRNGRIIRQGNQNEEVSIYNYVTKGSFDSYLWQILEKKQKFISQIMRGDNTIRRCDDLDQTVLQYAEIKALASGNPKMKEKMDIDNQVMKLTLVKSSWLASRSTLQKNVSEVIPNKIKSCERGIKNITLDVEMFEKEVPAEFAMTIEDKNYDERSKAADHLQIISYRVGYMLGDSKEVGQYAGFKISLIRNGIDNLKLIAQGKQQYSVEIGDSMLGAIQRMENLINKIPSMLESEKEELEDLNKQLVLSKNELDEPFPQEKELEELQERKSVLDLELEFGIGDNMGKELYGKLEPYLKPLLEGEIDHVKYLNEPYMPLVFEKIDSNEYSMCHYYEQGGDLMRDPEITFIIEEEMVKPTSFLQDGAGLYYRCEDVPQSQIDDLKEFMLMWANNIEEQGFDPLNPNNEEEEDLEH